MVKELTSEQVKWTCDPALFKCDSTAEMKPSSAIIGQDRALKALDFGLGIDNRGFNIPDASGNVRDAVVTPAGQSAHVEDGKVQCGSCHYAHGSRASYGMFLRVDNTGSALCMTCHTGPG